MASTTANKKNLVDFLWEWAEEHGYWAKLLINKVVINECELSSEERNKVFDHFLQSIDLKSGIPLISINKPTYTPTDKNVELIKLSNVLGVNRLAENQAIDFGKNMTVIFGENGTGKTGYSRILKSLGFSYDLSNNILPNVYESSPVLKSALIDYKLNEENLRFNWNGSDQNIDLHNISVFNSNCVQISISDSRQLLVSPIGFHLFSIITSELKQLSDMLETESAKYSTEISWKNLLNPGTPQQEFISDLSAKSKEKRLMELGQFSEKEESLLVETERKLSELNKPLIEKEIQDLNASIIELDKAIDKIESAQKILNDKSWQELITYNKLIIELEKKKGKGIKEIAESKGIRFYETAQFKSFINAAEEYIKLLDNPDYPKEGDICPYCQQPLESSANELLSSYRTLLNDKSEEELAKINKNRSELIDRISQIDYVIQFNRNTFGVDDKLNNIQPDEIIKYNSLINNLISTFKEGKINSESKFSFDYDIYIQFLKVKKEEFKNKDKAKKEILSNINPIEDKLKKEINELKDRKIISTKIDEINKVIKDLGIANLLKKQKSCFNSYSISTKTTEARKELIASNFEDTFKKELVKLRKPELNIDLIFGTSNGNTKLSSKICSSYKLTDILSEGEQKTIALAEFLTELQLDNIKAPVIFDDPVNSLDHLNIEEVAKRLIQLSKDRQVVVFTHSVLLFNSFLYNSSQKAYKNLNYEFYNTNKQYLNTGVIIKAEESINKVSAYVTKINSLINNSPKERPEAEVAKEGYSYLRSALELLVEQEIFQATVKRYQKNIAFTNFVKVDGTTLDTFKFDLNEIFERCCGYVSAHSNPEIVSNTPTVDGLKLDFKRFNDIRSEFSQRN